MSMPCIEWWHGSSARGFLHHRAFPGGASRRRPGRRQKRRVALVRNLAWASCATASFGQARAAPKTSLVLGETLPLDTTQRVQIRAWFDPYPAARQPDRLNTMISFTNSATDVDPSVTRARRVAPAPSPEEFSCQKVTAGADAACLCTAGDPAAGESLAVGCVP